MTESSRVRFTPANPGPVANSFARYVAEHFASEYPELEVFAGENGPAIAQALFSFHAEWQRERNVKGGEADQEKAARDAAKAAKLRETQAKKIAAAQKLLAEAGIEVKAAKAS